MLFVWFGLALLYTVTSIQLLCSGQAAGSLITFCMAGAFALLGARRLSRRPAEAPGPLHHLRNLLAGRKKAK